MMTKFPVYYDPKKFFDRVEVYNTGKKSLSDAVLEDEFVEKFPEISFVRVGEKLAGREITITRNRGFFIGGEFIFQLIEGESENTHHLEYLRIAAIKEPPSPSYARDRLEKKVLMARNMLSEISAPGAKVVSPQTFEIFKEHEPELKEYIDTVRKSLRRFEEELSSYDINE
jgi:hypothetical protein